jgi:hypothetical protein
MRNHENSEGERVEKNDLISIENFNELPNDEKQYYRIYTIMDNYFITEGLIETINKFVDKVKAIDPKDALTIIGTPQEYISEDKKINDIIVERILKELKRGL